MVFCIACPRSQAEELSTEDGKKVENGWLPRRHTLRSRKDLSPGLKRLFGGIRAPIGYGKISVERQRIYQSR